MQEPDILIFPDSAALLAAAARRFVVLARERAAAAGRFSVALAGGSTPRGLYQLLASAPLRDEVPWHAVFVIWGDERYVPHDDPESNYYLARTSLLDHVPVPAAQIVPVPTHLPDPWDAARLYDLQVRDLLAVGNGLIDLVLLGMGPDGHTASLFPHHPALSPAAEALAVAVEAAPKPPPRRVTLTAAALNRAAEALFLVMGGDKAETLRAVLRGPYAPDDLPAQRIQPPDGRVTWMVDAAAAARLQDGEGTAEGAALP